MWKRPLNATEEYRQVKKAYTDTELTQIYCKDIEMNQIHCSLDVKHKLQNECEQNANKTNNEHNIQTIRHICISPSRIET